MVLFSFLHPLYAQCPDVTWPEAEWPNASETTQQEKPDAVEALKSYAFTLQGKDSERKGIRTDGMLIIQHGQIIFEEYGRGFTRENPHDFQLFLVRA